MIGIRNDSTQGLLHSLNKAQNAVETSQERLSSGQRVNSAADDAAASALISQFAAQIAGSDQGMRNVSDGVSMFQTAESGVSQINDMVGRIRELSLQSGNGTLSDSDRGALQSEVSQLQEQIAQTVESTTFNGTRLLDRDASVSIQAGGNSSDAIGLETYDVQGQLSDFGFGDIDISTAAGAASALGVLDKSSEYLSGIQGEMGAVQNRFEYAIGNLQESNINTNAAQSRIQDADYAREISQLASSQIQQQANIAMMGQASSISAQTVSQLLGG